MDLNGKVALFQDGKTVIDIIDTATGQMVQQYDVGGTLYVGASVQRSIAAMAVCEPQHGVHVMDIKSGKLLSKFILPNGKDAAVTLSKDTLTLGVGTDTGV